jgi:Domain of unknown function (DUF1996)
MSKQGPPRYQWAPNGGEVVRYDSPVKYEVPRGHQVLLENREPRRGRSPLRRTVSWVVALALVAAPALWLGLRGNGPLPAGLPAAEAAAHQNNDAPAASDYINILDVPAENQNPPVGPNASTGSYRHDCGRNENEFHNADNFVVVPGRESGAHHMHDYLGNVSDWRTTDESLAASKNTSCRAGDQSTYFWPVLRDITKVGADAGQVGGGKDGNDGLILPIAEARVDFLGNAQSKVVAMPRFLHLYTGNAKAVTSNLKFARSQWGCAGFTNRWTPKYPLCPNGAVQRVFEYPSCWNGKDLQSNDLRSHVAFPGTDGACPAGTRAIPKLVITVTQFVPPGRSFATDAFPGEHHSPFTSHASFANVMSDDLMALIVDCINDGRQC